MDAKLWEDTVITAIRDEKWLHSYRHRDLPLPQIKLKGNAEQRLGDLIDVAPNDRFFLLEVKGTRDDIKAEWQTKNPSKNNQKDAVRAHLKWASENPNPQNLYRSLIGHFLAYWVEYSPLEDVSSTIEKNATPSDDERVERRRMLKLGACVAVESYLLACASLDGPLSGLSQVRKLKRRFSLSVADADEGDYVLRQQIPLCLVYEGLGYLVERDRSKPFLTISSATELGLKLEEFKEYVTSLCSSFGANSEPIHAVVMSTSGSFFRIATSTRKLIDLLGKSPLPNSDEKLSSWAEKRLQYYSDEKKAELRALAPAEQSKINKHLAQKRP